ncbi:MAG: TonB-dependent receptor [Opitutus sp.]|nr:TonB-dependent receptor [Opitutus sp.]
MKTPFSIFSRAMNLVALVCLVAAAAPSDLSAQMAVGDPGAVVEGAVRNAATNVRLRGAVVEIPAIGRQTVSDDNGRFSFLDLPAGEHTLVTSYIGLQPQRAIVAVGAGQRATRDFELTADIYKLEAFRVAGEREGNAAAITQQRNSPTLKNVVALDAMGNLSNENPGDLLTAFVPGVTAELDATGDVTSINIRGAASAFNTVNIDGNPQASTFGFTRGYRMFAISGALFDEIEVVKARTPDMPADALGGSVNMKTRSSLSMKEKRRFSFKAAARWAPPFFDHTPMRRDHPLHPILNAGYQEVFDVLGGRRNFAVSLNAFYSENANGIFTVIEDYAFTTASPAYVWDYRTTDQYYNRRQRALNLKFEYQLSSHTRVVLGLLSNDASTLFDHRLTMRAFTGRTLATIGANGQPTGTGAIMPGFTDTFTEVRNVAASAVQLNSTLFDFRAAERKITLGVRHEFDRWSLDYDIDANESHPVLGNAGGGIFTMDVTGVGWTLDKSKSATYPTFLQTSGPSIYDGASYRNGLLVTRNNDRFTNNVNASANARYQLPITVSSAVKTGLRYRTNKVREQGRDRRWNYVGTASLGTLVDPTIKTTDEERTGKFLPYPSSSYLLAQTRDNPRAWAEDGYFAAAAKFTGTRDATEEIRAAYASADAKFGPVSVLAGLRGERTDVESHGFVPSRVATATAQRTADPAGSARADNNNTRALDGRYTHWFPGAHATYRATSHWQARLNWSNNVGRPALANYLPRETASATAQTLNINNPSLKPQYTENIDAGLEYYFEPIGLVSAGVFSNHIRNYLVTATTGTVASGVNNGYNGDYAGYSIINRTNGGSAEVRGFEFSYQQQLTFLPGALKGLGVFANYTRVTAEGDYGGAAVRSGKEIADYIPESFNLGLSYRYRGFGGRIRVNHTDTFLTDYSVDPSQRRYQAPRTQTNLSVSYQFRSGVQVFADLFNVFNEPQTFYRFAPNRLASKIIAETTMTFGVSGKF